VPDVPSSDIKQGILPRLIATLVNRRKQVKSLMKDKSAPAGKQLQVREIPVKAGEDAWLKP
jgi:DNA polymerase alpha subunit A